MFKVTFIFVIVCATAFAIHPLSNRHKHLNQHQNQKHDLELSDLLTSNLTSSLNADIPATQTKSGWQATLNTQFNSILLSKVSSLGLPAPAQALLTSSLQSQFQALQDKVWSQKGNGNF